MKKTNFFKLLMVGALTLSLGLASCVSKSEFNDVCERLSAVELSIDDLTTRLSAVEQGNYVTNVAKHATENALVVTYKDNSTKQVDLGPGSGPSPVGFVALGENGNWFIDDEDTGIPAIGPAPKVEDGKWLWPVLEDGEIVWEAGEDAIYNAYATQASGVWTLYITDSATGELTPIQLPSAALGINSISVLGWTASFAKASNNVSLKDLDDLGEIFPILFAEVPAVTGDDEGNEGTWNFSGKNGMVEGGKVVVNKKSVLYANQGLGVIVEISPASQDLSSLTGFELQSSAGDIAPIAFGAPVNITGYLTRAKAASALYYIPVSMPATAPSYSNTDDFLKAIDKGSDDAGGKPRSVWSLVTPDGSKRSDYFFSIVGLPIESVKNDVLKVGGADTAPFKVEINKDHGIEFNPVAYGSTGDLNDANDDLSNVEFSNLIVDYYLTVSDDDKATWGIEFSDKNQKFKVKNLPDLLTGADFDLNVYTLGIDGVAYLETVTINPIRQNVATPVVELGDYIVEDWDPAADDYLSGPITIDLKTMFDALAATPDGSSTMLARWNASVQKYKVSIKNEDGNTELWPRFGDAANAVTDDSKDVTDKLDAGDKHNIQFGEPVAVDPTKFKANVSQADVASSVFNGLDKDGAIVAILPGAGASANVAKFTKLYFAPNYAYDSDKAAGTAVEDVKGTFAIGKKYTMVVTFQDKDDVPISSITATFTPKLPKLEEMFKKDTGFWEGNVLMARYRSPDKSEDKWFYDQAENGTYSGGGTIPWETTGTKTIGATYYNVYSPGDTKHTPLAPSDGGFVKAGMGEENKEKRWVYYADLALADADQEIGDNVAGDFIGTGANQYYVGQTAAVDKSTNATIVQLKNQTNDDQEEDVKNDAYGKEIGMTWKVGKYLGLYGYSADEVKAQNFSIRITSALEEEGRIGDADGDKDPVTVVAGNTGGSDAVAVIGDEHIKYYNYTDKPFSLFRSVFTQTLDADPDEFSTNVAKIVNTDNYTYQYTYIKSVTFGKAAPSGAWWFVDADGETIEADDLPTTSYIVDTGKVDEVTKYPIVKDVIRLGATNLQGNVEANVVVTITDRFGRVVEDSIPIIIKVN